jgi:hypothetical protein
MLTPEQGPWYTVVMGLFKPAIKTLADEKREASQRSKDLQMKRNADVSYARMLRTINDATEQGAFEVEIAPEDHATRFDEGGKLALNRLKKEGFKVSVHWYTSGVHHCDPDSATISW